MTSCLAQFKELAARLATGEVAMSSAHSLQRAMYAVQIMDPKMDTGILQPDPDNFDTLPIPTIQQTIDIIDQTWNQFFLWLEGAPLPTTLYSSTHLSHLKDLEKHQDSVSFHLLAQYFIILLNIAHHMRLTCISVNVCEPDDFETELYGFDIMPSLSKTDIKSLFKELSSIVHSIQTDNEKESLASRIRLLESLYEIIHFLKPDMRQYESAKAQLQIAQETLAKILKEDMDSNADDTALFFNIHLHRRVFAQGPPRIFKIPSIRDGFGKFISMLRNLSLVLTLENVHFDKLIMYLDMWTRSKWDVYSRSILNEYIMKSQRLFKSDSDKTQWMRDSFQVLYDCVVFTHRSSLCKDICKQFDLRLAECFENTVLVFSFNWCSIRRKMGNLILYYDQIQLEFESVEEQLRGIGLDTDFAIPSWVYHMKMRLVQSWLERGFDLDLYSPDEMVYKYLECTVNSHSQHLLRLYSRHQNAPKTGIAHTVKEDDLKMYSDELTYMYSDYHYWSCMNALQEKVCLKKEKLRFKLFDRLSSPRIELGLDFVPDEDKETLSITQTIKSLDLTDKPRDTSTLIRKPFKKTQVQDKIKKISIGKGGMYVPEWSDKLASKKRQVLQLWLSRSQSN